MLLRRVILHVRNQEWTAIWIDLLIVIIGVFLGIQLGNWNAAREAVSLERSYLDRIGAEVQANATLFDEYRHVESNGRGATERFASVLNNPSSTDAEIVAATQEFFRVGWTFPMFEPVVTTFEDIEATGNLQLISDKDLREDIVSLYAKFDQYQEVLSGNMDWLIPIDARITFEFDALRWDNRTAHLFPDKTRAQAAGEIRSNLDALRRVAATHYWMQDRMIGQYEEAIAISNAVAEQIAAELGQ